MLDDNQMVLHQVQEWLEKGHSPKDAAFGLIFNVCERTFDSRERDQRTQTMIGVAQTIALLSIGEELYAIRKAVTR